jgi:hypothetical protein
MLHGPGNAAVYPVLDVGNRYQIGVSDRKQLGMWRDAKDTLVFGASVCGDQASHRRPVAFGIRASITAFQEVGAGQKVVA